MLDLQVEDEPLLTVDRSDLESVDCPARMSFIRQGVVLNQSLAMDSGNAVHDAFSVATRQYVSSRGALNAGEVTEDAKTNLIWDTRPDLIWDAWQGFSPSVKAWGWFLTKIHPENVLRFDGGDGEQSGQLAIDFPDLGLRCTSEVDLLYAGPSPELMHEVDYKSGFSRWTQADVQNAFQFRFHAALIFHNFPNIPAVEIKVWNTRWNDLTYGVIFKRDRDYELILMEIRRRAEAFKRYHDKQPYEVPGYPSEQRCLQCPALSICVLSKHLAEPVANPGEYLETTAAMQRIVDKRLELLEAVVKTTGKDVVAKDGTCFGFSKPKRETKPRAAMYSGKVTEEPA
jgi:hypothetical protein